MCGAEENWSVQAAQVLIGTGRNARFTLSLSKEGEVDFEHSLEEGHVCSVVKTDL